MRAESLPILKVLSCESSVVKPRDSSQEASVKSVYHKAVQPNLGGTVDVLWLQTSSIGSGPGLLSISGSHRLKMAMCIGFLRFVIKGVTESQKRGIGW